MRSCDHRKNLCTLYTESSSTSSLKPVLVYVSIVHAFSNGVLLCIYSEEIPQSSDLNSSVKHRDSILSPKKRFHFLTKLMEQYDYGKRFVFRTKDSAGARVSLLC